MADDLSTVLRNALAGPAQPSEKTYGPFGEEYNVDYVQPPPLGALLGLRFGFRGMPPNPAAAAPDFLKTHREQFPQLYKAQDEMWQRIVAARKANEAASKAGEPYPSQAWKDLFGGKK